jgi:hypothetical protein
MRRFLILLVLALFCAAPTCGTGDGGDGDFVNQLEFGQALDDTMFDLVAKGGSQPAGTIWFRFEHAEARGDRFVRLYVNYPGSGGGGQPPIPYGQHDFTGGTPDDHILLSSFRVTDPGTYDVRAYLVKEVLDIGEETFIVSAPLTVTAQ